MSPSSADTATEPTDPEKQAAELFQEIDALHGAALDRAGATGDLRHSTCLAGGRLEQLIEQLWTTDVAAYRTSSPPAGCPPTSRSSPPTRPTPAEGTTNSRGTSAPKC